MYTRMMQTLDQQVSNLYFLAKALKIKKLAMLIVATAPTIKNVRRERGVMLNHS